MNNTSTPWSHLPNADHIDRVIASAKAHPDAWGAARSEAWDAARSEAWDAARSESWSAARGAARGAAWGAAWVAAGVAARGAAWGAAWDAAWGSILALVAYDHSAKYLEMPSEKLKVWVALSEEPAAVLILPAVIAFERIKDQELAA